jgi:hypothetical protein
VNGVSREGQLQTGLALDSAPYLLAYGDRITLNDYGRRYMVRLLSRFSVSVATAKAESSDDKAVRLALGFRATLWDLGDPRTNQELLGCFRDKLPALPTRFELDHRRCTDDVQRRRVVVQSLRFRRRHLDDVVVRVRPGAGTGRFGTAVGARAAAPERAGRR